MAISDSKQWLQTSRVKPSKVTDAVNGPGRGSPFGESYVQSLQGSKLHALADEGSYFYAQNPTIDAATTLIGHAAPVLADN